MPIITRLDIGTSYKKFGMSTTSSKEILPIGKIKNSTETGVVFHRYFIVDLKFSKIEPKGVGMGEKRGVYPGYSYEKCQTE